MIREKRNKEKLTAYYNKFMEEGIVDPNVHPWVAESWQRCRNLHLPHETMPKVNRLTREQVIEHQKAHAQIVEYVDGLYEQNKQHFNSQILHSAPSSLTSLRPVKWAATESGMR